MIRQSAIQTGLKTTVTVYRILHEERLPAWFDDLPCGGCPVFEDCSEGGLINAQDCPYLEQWFLLRREGSPSQDDQDMGAVHEKTSNKEHKRLKISIESTDD